MILSLYKERWQVGVKKFDAMPIDKLENLLSIKATKKQQVNAVTKIQAAVRGFLDRKRYRLKVKRRDEAARYIQRIWKRYRMISMVPKAWRKFKHDRITLIQKYISGYLVYKRIFHELNDTKLKSNFEYFNKIKHYLMSSAQIKIRYYWFKYKKAKAKKEETKKKKGKNTGNKRGSLVKKGSATYKAISPTKKSSESVTKPQENTNTKASESSVKSFESTQKAKVDVAPQKTDPNRPKLDSSIKKVDSKPNESIPLINANNQSLNSTMPIPQEVPLISLPSEAPSQVPSQASVPVIEEEQNEDNEEY